MRSLALAVSCFMAIAGCGGAEERTELTVAAASSLMPLIQEIVPAFEAQAGIDLIVTYAASGTLARQIENGAPIDVFLSADELYVTQLAEHGLLLAESIVPFAEGIIVPVRTDQVDITALRDANNIAIANPETAPYGAAAKRLLERNGLWHALKDRVVYAESALQALQFVRSGNADAGLLPLSLVVNTPEGIRGLATDELQIAPAKQVVNFGALVDASEPARRFLDFLTSDEIVDVLRSNGFAPPREEVHALVAR